RFPVPVTAEVPGCLSREIRTSPAFVSTFWTKAMICPSWLKNPPSRICAIVKACGSNESTKSAPYIDPMEMIFTLLNSCVGVPGGGVVFNVTGDGENAIVVFVGAGGAGGAA